MTILPIVLIPDPRLRQVAVPVAQITPAIKKLAADMLETMYAAPGIGLAATQVGVLQRVIVMDISGGRDGAASAPWVMVNPLITQHSTEMSEYEEACLSVPDEAGLVRRPASVTVAYTDLTGKAQQLDCTGLLATCVQHEIDHLNGVLFFDYLSSLKRSMIMRRAKKRASQRADEA